MTTPPQDRFQRHLELREVGAAGQARLARASALVVGAGGLGCAALPYLVAAGLRRVVVCDGDAVEPSNLPRQVLFGDADLGRPKAVAAAERLAPLNEGCEVVAIAEPLAGANVTALVAAADVVLDATDDFPTRYLLHDACFAARRALVTAAVHHDEGQLAVFRFDGEAAGPCWRCLWPAPPAGGGADKGCRDQGILGPVPGALGALQALQALRALLGLETLTGGTLVHFDLVTGASWPTRWLAAVGCPLCGATPATSRTAAQEASVGAQPAPVPEESGWPAGDGAAACLWIDARPESEVRRDPSPTALAGLEIAPWRRFGAAGPPPGRLCVVFCAHGIRSLDLARHWRRLGCAHVTSLRGGLAGRRRK